MKISGFRSFMLSLLVVAALSLAAGSAFATNGYFSHGYSTKNKALGGAGVALPLDSLAATTNPAGMVYVGNRVDFGLSLFNPNRQYTVRGNPTTGMTPGVNCNFPGAPYNPVNPPCPFGLKPGTVESDSDWFIVPSLGVNKMIDSNRSIGISIFGNGGMNTDYGTNTFNLNPMHPAFGSMPTGVDLMQLFIAPTYAMKVNQNHALGVSAIFAYQAFEARGLEIFDTFSAVPSNLTNNSHESVVGMGGRIGYMGEVTPGFFLGASYQTEIFMKDLDKYSGLFAQKGGFNIPANWTVGVAYKVTPDITVAADVQQILYSSIDAVGNPMNPAFNSCFGALLTGASASATSTCLGGESGPGFGWEDMTVLKLGVQWQSSPDLTLRAGYSYAEQPISSSEVMLNIVSPGVIEQHATAGLTKVIDSKNEIDIAVMRGFSNSISGPNPLDPPNAFGTGQTIELTMDQWEFTAGYTYKF